MGNSRVLPGALGKANAPLKSKRACLGRIPDFQDVVFSINLWFGRSHDSLTGNEPNIPQHLGHEDYLENGTRSGEKAITESIPHTLDHEFIGRALALPRHARTRVNKPETTLSRFAPRWLAPGQSVIVISLTIVVIISIITIIIIITIMIIIVSNSNNDK